MNELNPKLTEHKKVTVCTGTLVAEWFQSNWMPTLKNIKNLTVNHIPIENQQHESQLAIYFFFLVK